LLKRRWRGWAADNGLSRGVQLQRRIYPDEQFRPLLAASGAAFLAINQLRVNIGGYGDPRYTPGGHAKDFASAIEVRLYAPKNIEKTVDKEKVLVGRLHEGKTKKNQTAFWPRAVKVPVRYQPQVGIDRSLETYLAGVEYGAIVDEDGKKPSGKQPSFFSDTNLGSGQSACASYLDRHPDVIQEIRQYLLDKETSNRIEGARDVLQESEPLE